MLCQKQGNPASRIVILIICPRQPANPTPEQRIKRAANWAEQQRFLNVATDLRQALIDLERRLKAKTQ
jgi:hypothetical protein